MGHVLLVQSETGETTRRAFGRGVALYHALLGVEPRDVFSEAGLAVAKFPRLNGSGSKIERADAGSFRLTAGSLIAGDGLGVEAEGDAASFTCATDIGGRFHVYRADLDGGGVVIATSALVAAVLTGAPLDPLACQELLGAGSVFEDRSLFRGVRKLEAARRHRVAGGRVEPTECMWSAAGAARAADIPAFTAALTAALDRTLAAFPRAVIDLTGGFDSRAVVGAALRCGRPFRCVVNGDDANRDVLSAEGIARAFGLHLIRLRPGIDYGTRALPSIERAVALLDGEADAVAYADVLEIHGRLAQQGDATVNGSAGELIRGYWWDLIRGGTLDVARAARRFAPDAWAEGLMAAPPAPSLARHFEDVIRRAHAGLGQAAPTFLADHVYLALRMQRWAGRLASATDRIWPCVTPFMFREPLELALATPGRARNRAARAVIENLDPRLAALPMAGGYPAGPIRLGTAHRFAPLALEIAGKIRRRAFPPRHRNSPSAAAGLWAQEDVAAFLDPGAMRTADLYDRAALAAFLAKSREPGFVDVGRLGRVLTIELAAHMLARARGVMET